MPEISRRGALACRLALCLLWGIAPGRAALNPELLSRIWTARWISVPHSSPHDYGVYHFRRGFDLPSVPPSFWVHVTADSRYELFVNGARASLGPARGDLNHWRYESVDLAPLLRPGRNVLAAMVWNYSSDAAQAQITYETGLLVQGDTAAERVVDTGGQWKCIRDEAYRPEPLPRDQLRGYLAIDPGDRVDAARYPWGWEQPAFDDSKWLPARIGPPGAPRDAQDSPSRWMLVPRSIPPMENRAERLLKVRRAEGVRPPAGFPERPVRLEIPARTHATLLLDQTWLTTAYPELAVAGGKGAAISLAYAEALFLPDGSKGNRDEIEGKQFRGFRDVFLPDGGRRVFRPLWWRTWRYLQLSVETGAEPLAIEDLRGIYDGYPFVRKSRFQGGPPELQKILDVGWRTARLCAHETYMDCPYWEQLQYVGDTRVQSLVSLYTTGDARLMRNAIEQINSSRTAEGATYSRAPSRLQQYIPPFSLWWIGMLHDYWMYQDDPAFVRQMLPGMRAVLSFFAARQQDSGSLGRLPWWNFIDWTRQWHSGVPPAGPAGNSAPVDLQFALAYSWAADLEDALGSKLLATEDRRAAERMRAVARDLYWDAGRRMFADTPQKTDFSQQANALAVLAGVSQGPEARDLIDRVVDDPSLVQCSIYFRFYLYSALLRAGAGDRYLDLLGEWRDMLARGLTTWAEQADPTRSDCHAWGASPNYELFRTVLGIDSAAPGFHRVAIRPHLGKLSDVSGAIPHPKGEIAVSLHLRNGELQAEVDLPADTEGEFHWQGRSRHLNPGHNELR